jgi:hypothetical protein
MRKYIRNMIRTEGVRKHLKPSRWVKACWEQRQHKAYGVEARKFNQAKGTHKKYLWGSRVAMFAMR